MTEASLSRTRWWRGVHCTLRARCKASHVGCMWCLSVMPQPLSTYSEASPNDIKLSLNVSERQRFVTQPRWSGDDECIPVNGYQSIKPQHSYLRVNTPASTLLPHHLCLKTPASTFLSRHSCRNTHAATLMPQPSCRNTATSILVPQHSWRAQPVKRS